MKHEVLITYTHRSFFSFALKTLGGSINGIPFNRSQGRTISNRPLTGGEKSAVTQLYNRIVKNSGRIVCHIFSIRNRMPICQLGMMMEAYGVRCGHDNIFSAIKDLQVCGEGYAVKVGRCRKL